MSLKELKKRSSGLLITAFCLAIIYCFFQLKADENSASAPEIEVDTASDPLICTENGPVGPCEDDDDDDDHEHEWPPHTTTNPCSVVNKTLSGGDEVYCKGEDISYSLSSTGSRVVGSEETVYSNCPEDGEPYPGTNPTIIPHSLTNATFKWVATGCGANPANGNGETAKFKAGTASSSKNSSKVTFSVKSPATCDIEGEIPTTITPEYVSFTVVEVKLVKTDKIESTKDTPTKDETHYLVNIGWDETPDPEELEKDLTAELNPTCDTPPDDMTWSGDEVTSSNNLTTKWKSDKIQSHNVEYGCEHSKKALLIKVEGANISTTVSDSDEEGKYYQIFLNENFSKEEDTADLEGHDDCLKPDHYVAKYDKKGSDEIGTLGLSWLK